MLYACQAQRHSMGNEAVAVRNIVAEEGRGHAASVRQRSGAALYGDYLCLQVYR